MARSINNVNETTTPATSAIETLAAALRPIMGMDENRVREIAGEVAGLTSRRIEVAINGGEAVQIEGAHEALSRIIRIVARGHKNIYIAGPAGSGKTTLGENVAQALAAHLAEITGEKFGFISFSQGVTETHLFGRILPKESGAWEYTPSEFVRMYKEGGVFLLDEMDAADANLLVSINAALANGFLANPVSGERIKRHPKFLVVAAANTWGCGADAQYVGRNRMDGTTRDRFVGARLFVDYDRKLEQQIAAGIAGVDQALAICEAVWHLRERIAAAKLQQVASTRMVMAVAMAVRAGEKVADAIEEEVCTWSAGDRAKL